LVPTWSLLHNANALILYLSTVYLQGAEELEKEFSEAYKSTKNFRASN